MYRLLNFLSPVEHSLYTSLPELPLVPVDLSLLPVHFRILLQDGLNNPHFQSIGTIFADNLKDHQLYVSSQLLFWINLISSALNFNDNQINSKPLFRDLVQNFNFRQKKRGMVIDSMMVNLCFNPYLVLIRRLLTYHSEECLR